MLQLMIKCVQFFFARVSMNLKQRTIDILKKTNIFDPCNTGVMNAPLTVVSPKMILALRKSARQKLKSVLLALVSKNILCA